MPPGSLDTTFGGGDGFVEFYSYGVAIQPDGKIVVAGRLYDDGPRFSVARLNPDGSSDTSFDGDGVVITPIGTYDYANSVAIQADGKIVAAGYSYNPSDPNLALVRYNTDGSLDTTLTPTGS